MGKLTLVQRMKIVLFSITFLGRKREKNFKCCDFVKAVYKKASIPKLDNEEYLKTVDTSFGYAIFLKAKQSKKKSHWSHVVISLPFGYVIHNSYQWGEKVTITSLEKIHEKYNIVN